MKLKIISDKIYYIKKKIYETDKINPNPNQMFTLRIRI